VIDIDVAADQRAMFPGIGKQLAQPVVLNRQRLLDTQRGSRQVKIRSRFSSGRSGQWASWLLLVQLLAGQRRAEVGAVLVNQATGYGFAIRPHAIRPRRRETNPDEPSSG
jgi:hypothetical protein